MRNWIKKIFIAILAIVFLFIIEGLLNNQSFRISEHLSSSNNTGHYAIWVLTATLSAIIIAVPVALLTVPNSKYLCAAIGVIWFTLSKFVFFPPYVNPNLGWPSFFVGLLEAYGPKAFGTLTFIANGLFLDHRYNSRIPNITLESTRKNRARLS